MAIFRQLSLLTTQCPNVAYCILTGVIPLSLPRMFFFIYFSNSESPLLSTIVFSMVEDRRLSGKSSHSISKTLETPLITKLLLLKFLLLFCKYQANIVIAKMISCKTLLAIAERSYTFNKILWHDSFEF